MNCRHCGARLAPDDLVCGNCGNIVDTAPPTPTVASQPIPRTSSRQSASHIGDDAAHPGVCLRLSGTHRRGGPGRCLRRLAGSQADEQAQADKFYQEGLANRTAGKLQLAKADFEYVLKINPNYPGAREQMTQIVDLLTVKPTPTSAVQVNVTEQLYQAGVDAYDQKNWQTAIEILSQVRAIDPAYEKDRIAQMIYQAALTYGQRAAQRRSAGRSHRLSRSGRVS